MEPVSFALGVLPIAGAALKASKLVRRKLQIFRHHTREILRFQKLLDRQAHTFSNEIHLLVRSSIEDEQLIELMVEDPQHANWNSKEFEAGMRETLGRSYDVCREVIEDFTCTMEKIRSEFQSFDDLLSEKQENESSMETMRRLRYRVKFSFDESKLDKCIQDLRDSNNDLRSLRTQAHELSKPQKPASEIGRLRKQLSVEYGNCLKVKRASKALHEALQTAWSRAPVTRSAGNLRHVVRLFLDTRVTEEVHMQIAISCDGHDTRRQPTQQTLSRVLVRSQVLDWLEPEAAGSKEPEHAGSDVRKRLKVRFLEPEIGYKGHGARSTDVRMAGCLDTGPTDLACKDICTMLNEAHHTQIVKGHDICLGYIDSCSQEKFRHSFYDGERHEEAQGVPRNRIVSCQSLMSMSDMLAHRAEGTLSMPDQLRLARDVVFAVLKFHSTPWLRDFFTVNDLSFFKMSQDLPGCLQTLHIAVDFLPPPLSRLSSTAKYFQDSHGSELEPQDPEASSAVELAKLQHGVRNLTLWSLGTTLLQIGRWSRLQNPDDVTGVRKAAASLMDLGPKYRQLTKKCLDCDFSFGDDLKHPRLQQAVYETVICELNDLIKTSDSW